MKINGRHNYVVIAYDGKVQFVGTNKEGRNFYYNSMYFAHSFNDSPYIYNIKAMAEHSIRTKFFTYKKDAIEWANNYTPNQPSKELQKITAIATIIEAMTN